MFEVLFVDCDAPDAVPCGFGEPEAGEGGQAGTGVLVERGGEDGYEEVDTDGNEKGEGGEEQVLLGHSRGVRCGGGASGRERDSGVGPRDGGRKLWRMEERRESQVGQGKVLDAESVPK